MFFFFFLCVCVLLLCLLFLNPYLSFKQTSMFKIEQSPHKVVKPLKAASSSPSLFFFPYIFNLK